MLPQQRHQALPTRATTELPQGLQDRQIGFPRAVVFYALSWALVRKAPLLPQA